MPIEEAVRFLGQTEWALGVRTRLTGLRGVRTGLADGGEKAVIVIARLA
ncbi:MAG: hypothetical protein OEV51_01985 [Nitrospira sp.]|nr:hypothetical protein [Nitrospira sp.]